MDMKKILFLAIVAMAVSTLFSACSTSKVPGNLQSGVVYNKQVESPEGGVILLGPINRQGLLTAPYNSWFDETYAGYKPRLSELGGVSKMLKGVQIVVFMGTWCSDSQQEVPQFYQILDAMKFPESQLRVFAVHNDPAQPKTTPGGEHKAFQIEYVPTFIFMRDGKELGRIVEYPKKSLEADMRAILSKE